MHFQYPRSSLPESSQNIQNVSERFHGLLGYQAGLTYVSNRISSFPHIPSLTAADGDPFSVRRLIVKTAVPNEAPPPRRSPT